MATLANEMLDHSCDTDDEKMESIYQIDYIKRGNLITTMIGEMRLLLMTF